MQISTVQFSLGWGWWSAKREDVKVDLRNDDVGRERAYLPCPKYFSGLATTLVQTVRVAICVVFKNSRVPFIWNP